MPRTKLSTEMRPPVRPREEWAVLSVSMWRDDKKRFEQWAKRQGRPAAVAARAILLSAIEDAA